MVKPALVSLGVIKDFNPVNVLNCEIFALLVNC